MDRINLDTQISNFEKNRQSIISIIGQPAAGRFFGEALFSVVIGSNDFLNNYLIPVASVARQMLESPDLFVGSMISRLRLQLTVKILFNKKNLPSFKTTSFFYNQNFLYISLFGRDFMSWVLGR